MTDASTETRCPACQTVFAVAAEDLARAGGRVRCGDCLQVFDAVAHAIGDGDRQPPADVPDPVTGTSPAPEPGPELESETEPEPQPEPESESEPQPEPEPDDADDVDDEKFTVTNWFIVDESGELAPGPERDTDDSGAFRFGDDTDPDTLRAELAALTGDDIDVDETDDAATDDGGAATGRGDLPPDAVAGSQGTSAAPADDVLDDEDWDALLGELDGELDAQLDAIDSGDEIDTTPDTGVGTHAPEPGPADDDGADAEPDDDAPVELELVDDAVGDDTPPASEPDGVAAAGREAVADAADAGSGEPLDFELVDADAPGSETSVDLDLTRATLAQPAAETDDAERTGDAQAASESGRDADADADWAADTDADADADTDSDSDGDSVGDEDADDAVLADDFDADALEDMMDAVRLMESDDDAEPPTEADGTDAGVDADAVADGEVAADAEVTAEAGPGDDDAPATLPPDAGEPEDRGAAASASGAAVGEDTINAMAEGDRGEVIVLGDDPADAATDQPVPVAAADDDDPSFAESMIISPDVAPAGKRRTGLWAALSIIAVTALLVQVVHAWRGTLVKQPYWQDALPRIYGALGLPLAPDWDITRWCVETSGALASDAALDVESIFSNRGGEPLPPPILKVRIVDAYSDTLAATLIEPHDYLDGARVPDRVAPGQRITAIARLDYNEPRIDGYEVSLCYPGEDGRLRCNTGCPDDDR